MTGEPHHFITSALVGSVLDAGPESSTLSGLLVDGEEAEFATGGESGATLFTSDRVLVAQEAGLLSKRLTVKAFSRHSIIAYSIDPDTLVTVQFLGSFGQATLIFDEGFDPMQLSTWLGKTFVPGRSQV